MLDEPVYAFRCSRCTASFKREDHRRRHELTHAKPRHKCSFPGCEMRFHRTDVLKRHEEVHVPDPTKKRRRPRRGAEPKIKDSLRTSGDEAASEGYSEQSFESRQISDGICPDCGIVSTVCTQCLDALFESTSVPADSRDALLFCTTHHLESQMPRFSFIQCRTARFNWIRNGRLLAMAALGGGAIVEFKATAKIFFKEAITSHIDMPATLSATVSPCPSLDPHDFTFFAGFQTRIILVEYAIWAEDQDCEEWGLAELARMAAHDAPRLVSLYQQVNASKEHNLDALHLEEEICRTCWSFYCLLIRVSIVHDLPSSVPEILRDVRLPRPESSFATCSRINRSMTEEVSEDYTALDVPYRHALFALMSTDPQHQSILSTISPFAQYILIHSILELHDLALTAPYNFPTIDAFATRDKSKLGVGEQFWSALATWRAHFWINSEELWLTGHPEAFARLQANLLFDYAAIRMTDADKSPDPDNPHYFPAIDAVTEMSESMTESGILDVATKAHWMCDRASWWYACRMGRAQYLWVSAATATAIANGSSHALPDAELARLDRIARGVQRMRREAGRTASPEAGDPACSGIMRVQTGLRKMWTWLLSTEDWLD